jgi:hypothetical protein
LFNLEGSVEEVQMIVARVIAVGVLVASITVTGRAAEKPVDAAQAAAELWLPFVDAGDYDRSWDTAAKLFQQAVTKDQWRQAAAVARGPLGKLSSRKVKSREYKEQMPGAPDGKYVILQYDSVFENKAAAVETVVPMVDPDGQWRVSGYFIR